jgi:3-oxoacyl-[acyl-carrier protein] reductase
MEEASRLRVDLSTQVAIVTGATRGIGRSIAESLAASGAKVACVATNSERLAEVTQALTEKYGSPCKPFSCDVRDPKRVQEVVDGVQKEFEAGIDLLVNNAGVTRDNLMMRMKDEEWQTVLDINLTGPFLFSRAVSRPMSKARKGRIINISSVSGLMGNPGQSNYSASKAGLIGMTRPLAKELASRNVTVNAIAPGFIQTEMTDALSEKVIEGIREATPLKRLGEPDDIAQAVLFLASGAGNFITGQILTVDGGLTV